MIQYCSNAVPAGQRLLLEVLRYYVRLEYQSSKPPPPHPGLEYGTDLIKFLRTVALSLRALPDDFPEHVTSSSISSPPTDLQQEKLTLSDPVIYQICQAIFFLQNEVEQAANLFEEVGTLLETRLDVTPAQNEPPPRASMFRLIRLDTRELLLTDTLFLLFLEMFLRESTIVPNMHFSLRPNWQALADRWSNHLSSLPVSDLSLCSTTTRRKLLTRKRLVNTEQHPTIQILTELLTINVSEQGEDPLEEIHTKLLVQYIQRTVALLPDKEAAKTSPGIDQAGTAAAQHTPPRRQEKK